MTDEPWGRVIRDGLLLIFLGVLFVAWTAVEVGL